MTRRHFSRLHVGGPGVDGLQVALARTAAITQREIRGTVTNADATLAAGVHVHATSMDGTEYFTRALTDATGAYTLHVPSGRDARLTAFRNGDAVSTTDAPAAQGMASIQLAPTGTLDIAATDADLGVPIPVRIQVVSASAPAPGVPGHFGELQFGSDRVHIVFARTGAARLRVPVGDYRVIVSRGYEYEIFDQVFGVAANAVVPVAAMLDHSVATPGVMCADFHIHTDRSPDAPDRDRMKLESAAADGLEIPVRSDHDYVAAFESVILDLNLGSWLYGVPSLEVTTFTWGHMGIVPLSPDPARRSGGVFEWSRRRPPEVFAEIRQRAPDASIIINHPRSTIASGGYFAVAGYDPATGNASNPDYWDPNFDALEVFNDSNFESNRAQNVADWFSFLNRGRRIFAVGSSDTHSIYGGSPVGYPRTCLYLGTDDPRALTAEQVRATMVAGRSYVSGGIYIDAEGPGMVMPGQEATGVGASAPVTVTVQAATWIDADRLEVIVDGQSVQTITLDASTMDPLNPVVRYRGTINVPIAATESWVVFAVHGTDELLPVHPGRFPFGATNPIFLRR